MDPVPECKHPDLSGCTLQCECVCDRCQAAYEAAWQTFTSENKLCDYCGMPSIMTLDTLEAHRTMHFYQPCYDCERPYKEVMKAAGLCANCRNPLKVDGLCRRCHCMKPRACECFSCTSKVSRGPQPQ